jgi:hypothetical protein
MRALVSLLLCVVFFSPPVALAHIGTTMTSSSPHSSAVWEVPTTPGSYFITVSTPGLPSITHMYEISAEPDPLLLNVLAICTVLGCDRLVAWIVSTGRSTIEGIRWRNRRRIGFYLSPSSLAFTLVLGSLIGLTFLSRIGQFSQPRSTG